MVDRKATGQHCLEKRRKGVRFGPGFAEGLRQVCVVRACSDKAEMKLAAKLISSLLLGLLLLLGIDGYLSIRRETEFYRHEMEGKARLLGGAMRGLIADVYATRGLPRVLQLVDDANRDQHLVRVHWVWAAASSKDPNGPTVPDEVLRAIQLGKDASVERSDRQGSRDLITYVPVPLGGTRRGLLELSESLAPLTRYTRAAITRILALTGVLLVGGGLTAIVLGATLVGEPLEQLREQVRRIGAGDLVHRLRLRGRDEFSELADSMNAMSEQLAETRERVRQETSQRIEALDQVRHSDRLKTVGQLAAGIAHELGSPLNVVAIRAKLISDGSLTLAEARTNAGVIREQAERMATIVRQLLAFARPRSSRKAAIDLRETTCQTIEVLASLADSRNVTLRLIGDERSMFAEADAGQIQQVVTNLVVNAVQATPRGGTVEVTLQRGRARPPNDPEGPERDCLCLEIVDDGEGIAPENLGRLFEPFFTTKEVGAGTGLGLSIVHGIVREHGGWIDVTSQPGKGSRFIVCLPESIVPERVDSRGETKEMR